MKDTKIGWTDSTVNFWHGCTKVSPGCKFCYMYRDKERYGLDPTVVVLSKPKTFRAALQWKEPRRIFTNSWSDFFIREADPWREAAWDIIRRTPQHAWQILTKRPERIMECLPADWGTGWDNVWLGVSVETQATAIARIPLLYQVPAKTRFLSCEPLLEDINITNAGVYLDGGSNIDADWVIIGGESGNDTGKYRYRPCNHIWIYNILAQAIYNPGGRVPVFVKQTGTHIAKLMNLKHRHGADPDEWPLPMRVMEFPIR